MSDKIRFATYKYNIVQGFDLNAQTCSVTHHEIDISHYENILKNINEQIINAIVEMKLDGNCVCLINEIDYFGLIAYMKFKNDPFQPRELYNPGVNEFTIFFQNGKVTFYIAKVLEPIIGWK